MVSPELLRRYPLFASLSDDHLRAVSMLAEEREVETGTEVIVEGRPATHLCILIEGALDIHFVVADEIDPTRRKELFVTEINPGEPFGISSLVEPHRYMSTVRATRPSRLVMVQALGLHALCEAEPRFAAVMLKQVAKTAMSRLYETRVQLVAARV